MQIHPPPDLEDTDAIAPERPPVHVDVATESVRDVTLVRVDLRSDVDAPLRVRVRNRLDGPVLPPRSEGVPATGWDAEGFSGTLPANGTLGVGYACPHSPVDAGADTGTDAGDPAGSEIDTEAAVAVELRGPAAGSDDAAHGDDASGAVASAVRDLGRAVPPADAVPTPSASPPRSGPPDDDTAEPVVPDAVAAWLDAVAASVERAERLTDASAADAAAVLEDCDGPDGIEDVADSLTTDAAALRAVADRVGDLQSRSAAADPDPVVEALLEGSEALSERADAAATGPDR